jgi:aminopeptidase N
MQNRLYPQFHPLHYDIKLDIGRQKRKFQGDVTITGQLTESAREIKLHAKTNIISAKINGKLATH